MTHHLSNQDFRNVWMAAYGVAFASEAVLGTHPDRIIKFACETADEAVKQLDLLARNQG